jgi:hypothetical protein
MCVRLRVRRAVPGVPDIELSPEDGVFRETRKALRGGSRSIGVLSCVIQRNSAEGFVSSTDYASSFDALASVSSDIDPERLTAAMSGGGFVGLGRCEYPLPNGKTLVRQDFRPGT